MKYAPESLVSHYRLLKQIGAGGMGVVWKAFDLKLDREVALKFLPIETTGDPKRRERFIREAKAASALNHPNIVTIYEIGTREGEDFIAMEFIRGQPLSAMLRQGPAPLDRAITWAVQLSEALGKAHRAGITHRDIKPANIMITEDGFVKVLDFGLAKLDSRSAANTHPDETQTIDQALTTPGAVMGTIGYMPPEQILGEPAGSRSDVFSIGAVVYEMITGRRAFQGASPAETLRAVLSSDPAPQPPHIDGGRLFEIAVRCLNKSPEARYADAAELAADLRTLRTEFSNAGASVAPVTVTMMAADAALAPPSRARRLLLMALGAILLSGVSWFVWDRQKARTNPTGTPQVALPASPTEQYAQARAWLQRYDRTGNVDRSIEALQTVLNQNPNHAGALAALAEAYVRRSVQNPDPQWLKLALDAARRSVEINPELAAAYVARGMVLAQMKNNPEAVADLDRALKLDPLSAPATMWLGKVRAAEGKTQEAENLLRRATQTNPKDALPWGELGVFYYREARYEDAIESFSRAVDAAPDNTAALKNLGGSYHASGKYVEAAGAFQRALEMESTASTWSNLGTARFFQGQYLSSVTAMEKAVELAPNNQLYWGNLGDARRWTPGGAGKAKEAYTRAIQLAGQKLAGSPGDIATRSSLALYQAKSGDKVSALKEAQAVLAGASKTPSVWYKLALIYEIGGDRKQALAALESAIKAGYSMHEITSEPELASLRNDISYHRLVIAAGSGRKIK